MFKKYLRKNALELKSVAYLMSTRKTVNFYYSLINDKNKTIYRTLGDAEYHEVEEKDNLDYKKTINIRMDAKFTACDEDLHKY